MRYVTCSEARSMPGLRLVLSVGAPNPWGEAAKAVFHVRGVPFVAVGRQGVGDDPELLAWTGQANVPVAMYDDEKPRHTWIDILYLAERVGSGPSLLPADREQQVESIGLSHQICGEKGLGWNRRLDLFRTMTARAGGDPAATGLPERLFRDYSITPATMASAEADLVSCLRLLDERLVRQRQEGSSYLVGDRLTATDLHLATMFGMIEPLPHASNPMPDGLRQLYSSTDDALRAAVTPVLREHRDFIYRTHLPLPMEF